jgi:Calx-beta domain-containing protein
MGNGTIRKRSSKRGAPRGAVAGLLAGGLLAVRVLAPAAAALAAGWSTHAGNPHHTAVSSVATQPLEVVRWSTPVDLAPPSGTIFIHYGSPLVTPANTIIIPVKTGSADGFKVEARNGTDGSLIWSQTTDYILPTHSWIPNYSPALTPSNRVYFAGAGGTVYFRDNADSAAPPSAGQLAFFGLANYTANPASFNSTVFINTPITPDSAGNIYFGFRTSGTAPLGLQSGIARIDSTGNGTWISAANAAPGDSSISRVPHQAAPALSNDEQTLYMVVTGSGTSYLVALAPTTLVPKTLPSSAPMRVALKDPRNSGANNALVTDDSSATPMVGPDGDVYYGILENPFTNSHGWMLHFSGDLTQSKTPGAFGWDNTASIVPTTMVPSYTGTSPYLIFTKYNNYAGLGSGDGVNKIAVLDPNDPTGLSNGVAVMKEVLTIAGPTPDPEFTADFPHAVREWCINTAAVDPSTSSVFANSEDGKVYRWDLTTNTLSQTVTLSSGVGEAYTPTIVGVDGTVYAINAAVLNAVGSAPTAAALSINDVAVTEHNTGTTTAVFTVTLTPASTQTVTVTFSTADGSATTGDNDYKSAAGILTFPAGTTKKSISVVVNGDKFNEANETFFVNLGSPSNATIADGQGQGTILNDDALPALAVRDISVHEGNSSTTNAVFTVKLSAASNQTVTVHYATADGTATAAGNDYVPASGTVTFAPLQTSATFTVGITGDTVKEANETFFVNLSQPVNATISRSQGRCTISNDDK